MKYLLLISVLLISNIVFGQGEHDIEIKDGWSDYQNCIRQNMVEPIIENKYISSELDIVTDENELLLLIEDNYKKEIKKMLNRAILKSAKELSSLKSKYKSDIKVSIELSNIFAEEFIKSYAEHYGLNKCARNEADIPVFDYFIFFGKSNKLISRYNMLHSKKCNRYLTFAYLFKMAIIRYAPSLSDYVSEKVLGEWESVM